MKRCFLSFCWLVLAFSSVLAQQGFTIDGRVVDDKSNPVAGASVRLLNTSRQTFADAQGHFSLGHAPAGTVILEVTAVGYASFVEHVVVKSNVEGLSVMLHQKSKQLDEVVVSAQKEEELLQRLPVSVTHISATQVQEYRLWNSKDITAIVPNLFSYDPGDKRNVISVRGITTTSYDPAVATYIDGVNQFGLDTYIPQLFDVDHIEVLRGPQGTLYGRNAMGGVVNIITKRPTNQPAGFGEISIGNKGQQRYAAGIRVPLIKDKLFFGAASLYDHLNGFYWNDFNHSKYDRQNNATGNYYLKFLPGNQWALTLNVKHSSWVNHGPFPLVNGVEDAFKNPFHLSQNAVTQMNDNTGNASLSAIYTGPAFSFSSQTAYQSNARIYKTPIDADFSPIDGVTIINNYGGDWNKVKVWTQEFKFSSAASLRTPFKWTAGAYLFYQDNPVKQATHYGADAALLGSPDANFSLINIAKGKSDGLALFGQATYTISSKLDLTAGLRYDYEHKKQSVRGQYQHDPAPTPGFDYRSDTLAKASFRAVSPKLTLGYHASTNSLVFLSYSRGYRAGGLTSLPSDPSQANSALYSFKPEYSNNIEAGVKNMLLQNKLMVNITAFYTTVNDAQVPTLVLPAGVVITRNTGKLTSKGAELELAATPAGGLELDYSFGYNQAKYTTLKLAQNGTEVNLKGKYQLFTPDVTSMLAVQYSYALNKARTSRLVLRGEWKYVGRQYFDLANTIKQDAYSLLNTRFGFEAKQFSVLFWGRNLANKTFIGYAYDFGAVHLGDPKTIGATVQVRF
ncbi:MAG: TonB-dependent receptor [Williamsia sp.]|nr:TonB-dependent receptor [Williamsia sp.]